MKLYLIRTRDINRDIIIYSRRTIFDIMYSIALETDLIGKKIPCSRLDDFDVIEAAKNGYHIVAFGFIGFTYFSAVCQFAFGIDQFEQKKLIKLANENKKTVTIFPKYRLTILPFRYKTSAFSTIYTYDYTKGEGFSDQDIKMHLRKALVVEIDYIKSNKIVFIFADIKDFFRYTKILLELLSGEFRCYEGECYILLD